MGLDISPLINKILAGMAPLFAEARSKGLWFHCHYQDLWFTPDELEKLQAEGRFLWGATNWTLRDPKEKLRDIEERIESLQNEREAVARKIG